LGQSDTLQAKIRFEVEDTGVGMTPEQLEKIFLPFEQVGERSRQAEGTGLGLAIGQRIAQLMGSQLQVQSQLGQGSVFGLDLELPVTTPSRSMHQQSRKIVGVKGRTPTVLIVEDSGANRAMLAALFESIGFAALEASNGLKALSLSSEHPLDLIVTDLAMPVMDGEEMIQHLRAGGDGEMGRRGENAIQNRKDIPIIVASASAMSGDRDRSLAAGANAFLPKPIQLDELTMLLEQCLALEWLYEDSSVPTNQITNLVRPAPSSPSEIVPPDTETLKQLYHLAMMGHLKGIEDRLEALLEKNPQLAAFAVELKQLAGNFQNKKILQLLQSFMSAEKASENAQ
jgi:CheY-like chemotaxis protein